MKYFLAALQFLTKIPVKAQAIPLNEMGKCVSFFTLVGAVVGILLALGYNAFSAFFPHEVCIVMVLALEVFVVGGIHLDGFADAIDGFTGGGRDKEKILKIMQDASVGSFGVVGLILLFLIKFIALRSIPEEGLVISIIMACILSRWGMSFSTTFYKPAKSDGLGSNFISSCGVREFSYASFVALVLCLIFIKAAVLIIIPLILANIILFNFYAVRRLGGLTGDTLGAVNEIIEATVLVILSAIYNKGLL